MYLGEPGVIIRYKNILPEPKTYDFVTSIIIASQRGPIDTPVLVNSIKEFDYHFGNLKTESRRYVLSFLQYSPSLLVVRSVKDTPAGVSEPGTYNASSISKTAPYPKIRIDNLEQFNSLNKETFLNGNPIRIIARTPGTLGNNVKVAIFTLEQYNNNALIYDTGNKKYYAKNIIDDEFDASNYCVCVFYNDELVEVFNVPFNDMNKINEYSNEIYIAINYNESLNSCSYDGNSNLYDGNTDLYDGNKCSQNDKNCSYDGNSNLYDGNSSLYDGNKCSQNDKNCSYDGNSNLYDGNSSLYDGNKCSQSDNLKNYNRNGLQMFAYYGDSIIELTGGESLEPDFNDYLESAEVLENENIDIDLHIGWNVSLARKDVVNIVSVPKTMRQALDFKDVYNALYGDNVKMFIYGIKTVDKQDMGLCADYAGLRSRTVLTQGLGVSSSKITVPFNLNRLKTNPSKEERDLLYYNKINPVYKYKGIYYCNGEIIT